MTKLMKSGFIAFCILLLSNMDAMAQRRTSTTTPQNTEQDSVPRPVSATKSKTTKQSTDNYFDESGGFKHRLQYGIHTNSGILSFFNGYLNLRIEPSVGYKITNWAMVGITGGLEYQRQKATDRVETASIYNYGVYGRIKAFKSLYVHTDYRFVTGSFATKLIGTDTKVSIKDSYKPEANVGIAYRSGLGAWGYEIMGVYNLNHTDGNFSQLSNKTYSFRDSPLDVKIGFTYNF
jgi:hypothetical protein